MELEAFKEIKRINGQIGFAVKVIGFDMEHFLPITLAHEMYDKVGDYCSHLKLYIWIKYGE